MGVSAGKSEAEALFFFGEETKPAFDAARLADFRGLAVFETDFTGFLPRFKSLYRPGRPSPSRHRGV